jgi:hypothetical protein
MQRDQNGAAERRCDDAGDERQGLQARAGSSPTARVVTTVPLAAAAAENGLITIVRSQHSEECDG